MAVFVLICVLNCSRIEEKVEQKVNEKIDKKIDETMKKIDTSLSVQQIDSLKHSMDSLSTDSDKRSKKVK